MYINALSLRLTIYPSALKRRRKKCPSGSGSCMIREGRTSSIEPIGSGFNQRIRIRQVVQSPIRKKTADPFRF